MALMINGRYLAFSTFETQNIYVLDMTAQTAQTISGFGLDMNEGWPPLFEWSPDNQRLAFLGHERLEQRSGVWTWSVLLMVVNPSDSSIETLPMMYVQLSADKTTLIGSQSATRYTNVHIPLLYDRETQKLFVLEIHDDVWSVLWMK